MIYAAMMTASLLSPAAAQKTGELYMENETDIRPLNVELQTDYGQLILRWDVSQEADNYLVTAIGSEPDGSTKDLYSISASNEYMQALDLAAYVCQEYGFPSEMCFRVDAVSEENVIASGISASFDPKDYYPEKEELIIGQDIPEEAVTGFSWSGSGTMVNDSFHFSLTKDEMVSFSGSWYDDHYNYREKERILNEADWNKLLEILRNGKLVREHIMDPGIEILDGTSETKSVAWEGMTEKDRFYVFFPADESAFEEWIRTVAESTDVGQYAPYIAIAGSAVLGLLLLGRRLIRRR